MWKEHDATELVKRWKGPLDILIDVVGQVPFQKEFYCLFQWAAERQPGIKKGTNFVPVYL